MLSTKNHYLKLPVKLKKSKSKVLLTIILISLGSIIIPKRKINTQIESIKSISNIMSSKVRIYF